jgi:hypothetical protein
VFLVGIDSHYGDEDVKEQGKWFPIKGEDAELLIRHAGNSDYMQYLMENMSEDAREFFSAISDDGGAIQDEENVDLDEGVIEEANEVIKDGAAKHILVDWKNVSLEDPELAAEFDKDAGDNIGYTNERARKMFDLIPDFFAEVRDIAQDQAAFKKEQRKHDKGN